MPMSPRLLRPRASGLHPEAQDWRNRVIANGGTVSGSTLTAVSNFCRSIDAAGIRDRFYRLNLFCGTGLSASLVPLYRGQSRTGTQFGNTADTNVNFVAGDYTETGSSGGLSGNGTNKYLNTGFAPNNISFGNAHACGYLNRSHTSGNFGSILHSISALNNDELGILSNQSGISTPPFFAEENTATGFVQAGVNNTTGMLLGTSTSSTDRRFYIAGSQSGTTVTNALTRTQYTNLPMFVMARNFASNPTGWNNGRICAYSVGLGMTASQASAYYTAMQAFQTALSRAV